jgi:tetratricopeptide (TPR) repeat protein
VKPIATEHPTRDRLLAAAVALALTACLIDPLHATLEQADAMTAAIGSLAADDGHDPRNAAALALIKAGNAREAEPILRAVAADAAERAGNDPLRRKAAATAYRNLATIAHILSPARAKSYFEEASRLDPSDLLSLFEGAAIGAGAGNIEPAFAAFQRVIAEAPPGTETSLQTLAHIGLGQHLAGPRQPRRRARRVSGGPDHCRRPAESRPRQR